MGVKNRSICHCCRDPGHTLLNCPNKKRCLDCVKGIMKMIDVERKTDNIVQIFLCCTLDCGYFKWNDVKSNKKKALQYELGKSSGDCNESRTEGMCLRQTMATSPFQDLSHILQAVADLKIKEEDVAISFNLTIRKGKTLSDNKGKEKCSED